MANPYFRFKQFTIYHDRCAMKVSTDSCLFGAWTADEMRLFTSGTNKKNVLDIGTGTGLLSLMIRQRNPVQVNAIEIDPEAAEQAQENVSSSPWAKDINVIHKDILLADRLPVYDVVVSNPPFYENELSSDQHKKNLAHHSSELNMGQVIEIISQILNPQGVFFLLLPYKRTKEIEKLIERHGLHLLKKVDVRQSVHHSPFRTMIFGGKNINSNTQITELSIWNENREYTPEFIQLLKDYYLKL